MSEAIEQAIVLLFEKDEALTSREILNCIISFNREDVFYSLCSLVGDRRVNVVRKGKELAWRLVK
jgi:hypothetical protein